MEIPSVNTEQTLFVSGVNYRGLDGSAAVEHVRAVQARALFDTTFSSHPGALPRSDGSEPAA